MEHEDKSPTALAKAKAMADRLFEGRTGHGRAPISYLQLRRETLADVLAVAIEVGIGQQLPVDRLKAVAQHLRTAEELVRRIELEQRTRAAGGAGRPQSKPYRMEEARADARRAGDQIRAARLALLGTREFLEDTGGG